MAPPDAARLSLNTATIRKQWGLAQAIEGCARHAIRGMMGDGVIDLPRIRSWVQGAGYSGFHEVEIFSELDWWKRDPDQVLQICKDRFLKAT